jgi:Fe-S cluster assembly iron-binding protein IscA
MRITLEQDEHKTIIDTPSVTCDDVLQDFIQALLGQGFQLENIKSAILGKGEEYE